MTLRFGSKLYCLQRERCALRVSCLVTRCLAGELCAPRSPCLSAKCFVYGSREHFRSRNTLHIPMCWQKLRLCASVICVWCVVMCERVSASNLFHMWPAKRTFASAHHRCTSTSQYYSMCSSLLIDTHSVFGCDNAASAKQSTLWFVVFY